jgi:hypothetical protein
MAPMWTPAPDQGPRFHHGAGVDAGRRPLAVEGVEGLGKGQARIAQGHPGQALGRGLLLQLRVLGISRALAPQLARAAARAWPGSRKLNWPVAASSRAAALLSSGSPARCLGGLLHLPQLDEQVAEAHGRALTGLAADATAAPGPAWGLPRVAGLWEPQGFGAGSAGREAGGPSLVEPVPVRPGAQGPSLAQGWGLGVWGRNWASFPWMAPAGMTRRAVEAWGPPPVQDLTAAGFATSPGGHCQAWFRVASGCGGSADRPVQGAGSGAAGLVVNTSWSRCTTASPTAPSRCRTASLALAEHLGQFVAAQGRQAPAQFAAIEAEQAHRIAAENRPSMARMPTASREAPRSSKAFSAPASMARLPLGSRAWASQPLRSARGWGLARTGCPRPRPPARLPAPPGRGHRPGAPGCRWRWRCGRRPAWWSCRRCPSGRRRWRRC